MTDTQLDFLRALSRQFPTIGAASTEIINLEAILNLPKGTEHFLTDVHGENEQFLHVLKNGSGTIRTKIDEEFGNTLSDREKRGLATLIYYPREKMELVLADEEDPGDWYKVTLFRLVAIVRRVAGKYTRSKVRKALPREFAYVIEELITEKAEISDKEAYYHEIVYTIIRLDRAQEFIVALCELVQRLVIDHLHIVGDIYDRGPGPHIIMDAICRYHSVDIQWGNHDIVWMGAAAGSEACICNVIRMAARYGHLGTIEEGYGINLIPLAKLAMELYPDEVNNSAFAIRYDEDYDVRDLALDMRMHKAVTILQFKAEGKILRRHPEYGMDDRLLLDKIDAEGKRVCIDGVWHALRDAELPTLDAADPYAYTAAEALCMKRLVTAFRRSDKLQRHVRFLYTNGSLYKTCNSNLLYHGCVPMDEDGSFQSFVIDGTAYRGRALYDALEYYARKAYFENHDEALRRRGLDLIWYIWCGPCSPVFGKNRMTTFERYFVEDKATHREQKNAYYRLCNEERIVDGILAEFGLGGREHAHIVNGHVPVEQKKGESPVKCGGKLLVIDGGFSKAYHTKTGIAGYTLVANSHGMRLVQHEFFESTEEAIRSEKDILSDSQFIETYTKRRLVEETDTGKELQIQIAQLEQLLQCYRDGVIIEQE
ncbi:fructose-1,6-bisphosphatase [Lachnoclostridium sp. Marseille-P6806]|uniref:fructose-1,6-bisphosphatase n=1 Tax=Lachnoclostridium sp. Marseille-P6806 TaxID=2364793 RepID=UPI001030A08F|nr:fructose-1,6-bisphosphatase [Lachnoclostridium sp. Marseille-P6806]